VLSYIVLDKNIDKVLNELKNREVVSNIVPSHIPVYYTEETGFEMPISIDDKIQRVPAHDNAVSQYLRLLGLNCRTDFIKQCLTLPNTKYVSKDLINDLMDCFWRERYAVPKRNKIKTHFVKDSFSPEGEIRAITTTRFKRYEDRSICEFVENYLGNDYDFFQATLTPLKTSIGFLNDNQIIETNEGDRTKLGLCVKTSEFGVNSVEFGIYTMRVICTNQFTSRNRRFLERIVHRQKDIYAFKTKTARAINKLSGRMDEYGKIVIDSKEIKLRVDDIGEIIERPPTTEFGRLSQKDKKLIIDAYELEPLGLNHWGLFNAGTRVLNEHPEKRDDDGFLNGLDSLLKSRKKKKTD